MTINFRGNLVHHACIYAFLLQLELNNYKSPSFPAAGKVSLV